MFGIQGSIANKLTVLYTLASVTILFVIAILLYAALNLIMLTAEKQYLIDEVSIIRYVVENNPKNYNVLNQEVNGVPASLKNSSYFYYIKIVGHGIIP